MRRSMGVAGFIGLGLLILGAAAFLHEPRSPRAEEAAMLEQLADSAHVKALYDRWVVEHERGGGDGSVEVPLAFFKGLSVEHTTGHGLATLDLLSASISVKASGLPPERIGDVWLVDNLPGAGKSAYPESGDELLFVGTLAGDTASASLAAVLPQGTFDSFRVDAVVVARRGADPLAEPVLFGAPGLFQRLYTGARQGDAVSESELLPQASRGTATFLGSSPAYAAGIVVDPDVLLDSLVSRGADLFINERFSGNGRTCATCHPAVNNFTIDPKFIARLPKNDPLFVAEFVPALAQNFEKPLLMRKRGLILENLDGFEDLANKFTMRGVPHVLALGTSLEGPNIPFDNTSIPERGIVPPAERTGWSGDGAPGSGTLREFSTGAVIQHFTKTLNRRVGVDFRLPTDTELDAMAAFQLALGREQDINLSDPHAADHLFFTHPVVERGKQIFNTLDSEGGTVAAGKCSLCHQNAGANLNVDFFGAVIPGLLGGNANFATGVNDLPALPADVIDPAKNRRDGGFARIPHDGIQCSPARGGFGTVLARSPGICEEDFNTPPLVEAADTGPFFHNNAVDTLEAAVSFYNDPAFNQSSSGQLLAAGDSGGIGIALSTTEVTAVANMLRVVNALENLRAALDLSNGALFRDRTSAHQLIDLATVELLDAIEVLEAVGLHPEAVAKIDSALGQLSIAKSAKFGFLRDFFLSESLPYQKAARDLMATVH